MEKPEKYIFASQSREEIILDSVMFPILRQLK